jgi:ribosomal protein S18 acetylase RimI-like enzyme
VALSGESLMDYVSLRDKVEIERFLREDVYLHIYSIGDLDDFFWPYTTWHGFKSSGSLAAIALLYAGLGLPTLVALCREEEGVMLKLLDTVRHLLPDFFNAHLSPGLASVFPATHDLEPRGEHYKMALVDKAPVAGKNFPDVERLSTNDLKEIQELYRESYPGNWFDPRMLETNKYFGMRENGRLVSIAGVHVFSKRFKVAALGNITTLPAHRNKGYGARVTGRLCQSLLDEDIQVGLNVKADNTAAISCYRRIGFRTIASYEEYTVQIKSRKE